MKTVEQILDFVNEQIHSEISFGKSFVKDINSFWSGYSSGAIDTYQKLKQFILEQDDEQ